MKVKKLGYEQLEDRLTLAASIVEFADIGYFFKSESNVVQRYDIAQEKWLDAISLQNSQAGPTVAHVDADGIYAGFDRAVYRYQLDGSLKTHLVNLQSAVIAIHSDNNLLLIDASTANSSRFLSLDKRNSLVVDAFDRSTYYFSSIAVSCVAPESNAIFTALSQYSSLRIARLSYDTDGRFATEYDTTSNYGDHPDGNRCWVFPDETKLLHSSGAILSANDLRFLNRVTTIDDVGFFESQILFVLAGKQITAYSKSFLPTGSVGLSTLATKIFINQQNVIAFIQDDGSSFGYRTEVYAIGEFDPGDPSTPIDPTGIAYTPDWIGVSNQARVLLLSKSLQNIFVWNPMTQAYQRSIGLIGSPISVAYDNVFDRIYVAYESGLIYTIELDKPDPKEVPLARLLGHPLQIQIAGDYVFAVTQSAGKYLHQVVSRLGEVLSYSEFYENSGDCAWNNANNAMYSFIGTNYSNRLIYEPIDATGKLRTPVYSPYYDSSISVRPIHFPADGKTVLLGSGSVLDFMTMARSSYGLANNISDAVWFAGRWVTVRNIAGIPQLQEWVGQTLEPVFVRQWKDGNALSIQALNSKRIVITILRTDGVPSFYTLNENLFTATVNNTWHNNAAPMDVDDDEFVSPLDILIMIDQINLYGSRQTVNVGEHFCDADNDGVISPLDVLAVINWINIQESNESKASGEIPEFSDELLLSLDLADFKVEKVRKP